MQATSTQSSYFRRVSVQFGTENMRSPFAFFILFSLLPFSNVITARKDTGEYWRAVMKDQPMPEAIHGLIRPSTLSSVISNEKADCHTTESSKKNNFVKDFGPQPSMTAYDNGIKQTKEESFSEDFDPSPNISVYNDGVVKGERSFAEDFDPSPNISVYNDGVGLKGKKKLFSDDIEPRPSVTAYSN
ncbi:PROTEIN putative-RELATED [Salix purpurea]|uniref:PROTEIN putative-RELATED n=1 Tax=Salix purpurea TaxID=77065 RepID=A0A9Q0SWI4_SALPP|nr:PROTEIN putative-RELATED [Salix purpurea]